MPNTPIERFTCDRCGFDYKKADLRKQRGMYLSHDCFDILDRIPTHRPRFNPPRDDSTSTGIPASDIPEVLTVSAGTGINQIFQSHELATRRDGRHISVYMKVISDGGAITISADPQIIDGAQQGDLLTLKGTSDTDTVTISDAGDIALIHGAPMTLKDGDTISFVYNADFEGLGVGGWGVSQWGQTGYGFGGTDEAWVETSRYKGGL